MFGFRKKKDTNSIVTGHYEGLKGFKQDFPCTVILEDNHVVFQNNEGNVAKLPYDRILTVDSMPEEKFMVKYHNTKCTTKKGTVWFKVITYTSATGEEKYIAFWDVSLKVTKFFEQLEARVRNQATEIIL